jgi:hypothetical protein
LKKTPYEILKKVEGKPVAKLRLYNGKRKVGNLNFGGDVAAKVPVIGMSLSEKLPRSMACQPK